MFNWLKDKATSWIQRAPVNKIDTHHHFVPDFYRKGSSLLGNL